MLGQPKYIAVIGATASGKSALGLRLAEALQGEIVSCDSVQVYRGFDIGSAKPSAAEQRAVPHHLIDIKHWREDYDAQSYAADARELIRALQAKQIIPIVVGGTGLYFRALCGHLFHDSLPKDPNLRQVLAARSLPDLYRDLQRLDPERAAQLHPNDRFRIGRALEIIQLTGRKVSEVYQTSSELSMLPAVTIMLDPPRPVLQQRIAQRASSMLQDGLVSEVDRLVAEGCPASAKPMQSIGYREVRAMLDGTLAPERLTQQITIATNQYAKRQQTWFQKTAVQVRISETLTESQFKELEQQLRRDLAIDEH